MEYRIVEQDIGLDIDAILQQCKVDTDDDVAVILLKPHNPALLKNEKSFEIKIWGKPMFSWCMDAFKKFPVTEVECELNSDIMSTIKPHLKNQKYTCVFYADTPLIQDQTVFAILDYVKAKNLSALKLERGWVFETESIKNGNNYSNITTYPMNKEEFFCVFNQSQLATAREQLKKRIMQKHLLNGVNILDTNSCFIDATAVLETGSTIYPNNCIFGKSRIESGAVLKPFNSIEDSIIKSNVTLENCIVKNKTVEKTPKPFSVL